MNNIVMFIMMLIQIERHKHNFYKKILQQLLKKIVIEFHKSKVVNPFIGFLYKNIWVLDVCSISLNGQYKKYISQINW